MRAAATRHMRNGIDRSSRQFGESGLASSIAPTSQISQQPVRSVRAARLIQSLHEPRIYRQSQARATAMLAMPPSSIWVGAKPKESVLRSHPEPSMALTKMYHAARYNHNVPYSSAELHSI